MNYLNQSYKYLIELTEAYQNDFITKDEYKSIRANEMFLCALRLSKLKAADLFIYTGMYVGVLNQVRIMLNKPKPSKFLKGCAIVGEHKEELILTPENNFVSLPKNIKL